MRPYVPGLGELLFGLSLKKKNTLYRNLGVSLGSGLPLTRALDLASTELSVSVKRDMQEAVAEGLTLSQIWLRYPALFSVFEAAMIKAGEISGNLEKTVSTLASRFEAEHERANAMRAQLAYPILMIHAAVLIPAMPIMVTSCPSAYVFTVCMILLPLYLAFFLLLALSRISRVSSELAYVLSAVANCVPVWRGVRRLEAQGRFLECLAQLIEAGMLAGQSLEIAASACGNEAYARSWKRFSDDISNGLKISQALQNSKTFSAQVYSMIAAGEESGNIVSMASKAADYLLDEAVQQRKRLMAVMPVVLLLLIGIVVAYQVISIFGGYSCSLRGMM